MTAAYERHPPVPGLLKRVVRVRQARHGFVHMLACKHTVTRPFRMWARAFCPTCLDEWLIQTGKG